MLMCRLCLMCGECPPHRTSRAPPRTGRRARWAAQHGAGIVLPMKAVLSTQTAARVEGSDEFCGKTSTTLEAPLSG